MDKQCRIKELTEHLDMSVSSVEIGLSSLESEVGKLELEVKVGFERIGHEQESNDAKIKVLEKLAI